MPAGLSLLSAGELIVVGLVSGVLGGMLGIGGGLIMIPAMLLILGERYGPATLHLFKLASITTSVVVALPAAIQHGRNRAVVFAMLPAILPLALVGVLVGVFAAAYFFSGEATATLRRVFGAFMLLVVAWELSRLSWRANLSNSAAGLANACPLPTRWGLLGGLIGLPAGLIAGLLGIGGGVWAVPAQHLLLGIRVRNAIANSTCAIVVIASTATVFQSLAVARMPELRVADGWWLALFLAPGAVVGGWWGGWLTHRLPVLAVRLAFFALMGWAGYRLATG